MSKKYNYSTLKQATLAVLGSILAVGGAQPAGQQRAASTGATTVTSTADAAQAQKSQSGAPTQSSVPGSALRGLLESGGVDVQKRRVLLSGLQIRAIRMAAGRSNMPTRRRMRARLR